MWAKKSLMLNFYYLCRRISNHLTVCQKNELVPRFQMFSTKCVCRSFIFYV